MNDKENSTSTSPIPDDHYIACLLLVCRCYLVFSDFDRLDLHNNPRDAFSKSTSEHLQEPDQSSD